MPVEISKQRYSGIVKKLILGSGKGSVTVGGETAYPFYTFEGSMPNPPRIAIQVLDCAPDDWAEACKEPYNDVLHDPVAWAIKAHREYKADMIHLWLKSTDPNGLNRSAEEAARTAKAVADSVPVPIIVWGTLNAEKDIEVLKRVTEECEGKHIIIGPVQEENNKQLGALALAYDVMLVANTPIDINLAKQLNILLNNVGVPTEKIIIDPTTGGLGYGLEYTYSVMERIRQAAITQNDDKLQSPFFCNLADEVWKTKEAKMQSDQKMGDAEKRGILMEAITAVTLLNAGADILVMRHPQAIYYVHRYIAKLGCFEMPDFLQKTETIKQSPLTEKVHMISGTSKIADSLQEGALCKIVQIMDMPVELAPGYAIALIKSIDPNEAEDGIVLKSKSADHGSSDAVQEQKNIASTIKETPVFKPSDSWKPLAYSAGDYDYKLEGKKNFSETTVSLIGKSYDPGSPHEKHDWRTNQDSQEDLVKQVKTDHRYWYSEGYGSEKRKKPA